MIHTRYSDIPLLQWQQLVEQSANASFFQTPACYDFYASLSFLKPFVYWVSENGSLVGVMCGYVIADGNAVKQFFSRRAIVPGGLLLDAAISPAALAALLAEAAQVLSRKAIYLEIRNYSDYSAFRAVFEQAGFVYQAHMNFHVPTPDVETVLKNLSTTKRRDVKLSKKEGAEWFETTDSNDLQSYYQLLENLYATKIKLPLFPFAFFERLVQLPECKLFVVKYQGKVIGGSVCVLLPNKAVYEWFVCGLDGQTKNIFPSTLATWAAIEYAAMNGYERFDMMGAGKPEEGYGVREFKSKFGGELVEQGRFLHINSPFLYKLGGRIIQLSTIKKKKSVVQKISTPSYRVVNDTPSINRQAWRDFVSQHPDGNIFQTPKMYELYSHTAKYKPDIILVEDENNLVVGCLLSVVQREYLGLLGNLTERSIVMGGPLIANNNPDIANLVLSEYLKRVSPNTIYSQFRNLFDMSVLSTSFKKKGFTIEEHLDILIDLTLSVEELTQNLHKERKRNISKAEKAGLIFKKISSEEEINMLISILKRTYKRVKIPLYEDVLFHNAIVVLGDKVACFGAFLDGKMVAAQVRLCYRDTVYAWFGGSDENYYHVRPNDFLLWNVLLWSKANNFSIFDFGGAGKPNVPYGVRDYKIKYGGDLVNYGRFEIVHNKILMYIGRLAFKLYKL